MRLADYQDLFQRGLLTGDARILDQLVDSPRENRARLFRVYQDAYRLRLLDVARSDFPVTLEFLGRAAFDEMATAYIAAHPSREANLRWFARALPDFLAATAPWSTMTALADLAAIERALYDVFDAADGTRLVLADLQSLAPEDWPGVVFSPHPATRRIRVFSNARDIWKALSSSEGAAAAPEPVELAETQQLVFYRPELVSTFRAMPAEEAMMWDEMCAGLDFAGLCEMVATFGGETDAPLRAAAYLQGWIAAGMLAGPEAEAG